MFRKCISMMMLTLPLTSWGWGAGYYVGGGVGAQAIDYNYKTYTHQAPDQQAFSVLTETHYSAQGIFGTAFGGYSWVRQNFYLATEVNVDAGTATFKTTNSEFDHPDMQATFARLKLIPTWGLSLIPGWVLCQDTTLLYARVGYEGGVFQITSTDSSLKPITDTLAGFRYGFGIEKRLFKNWDLRLEYDHIIYKSSTTFKIDDSSGFITQKQTAVIPQVNQFEFGLVYRFC